MGVLPPSTSQVPTCPDGRCVSVREKANVRVSSAAALPRFKHGWVQTPRASAHLPPQQEETGETHWGRHWSPTAHETWEEFQKSFVSYPKPKALARMRELSLRHRATALVTASCCNDPPGDTQTEPSWRKNKLEVSKSVSFTEQHPIAMKMRGNL